jgi:hypothetical protein
MPTRTAALRHVRRARRLLLLVAALLVMATIGSVSYGASDPPCKDGAVMPRVLATTPARLDPHPAAEPSTGLDLELRIWHLRIEFPWLKALPVSPGRHIVVSFFDVAES